MSNWGQIQRADLKTGDARARRNWNKLATQFNNMLGGNMGLDDGGNLVFIGPAITEKISLADRQGGQALGISAVVLDFPFQELLTDPTLFSHTDGVITVLDDLTLKIDAQVTVESDIEDGIEPSFRFSVEIQKDTGSGFAQVAGCRGFDGVGEGRIPGRRVRTITASEMVLEIDDIILVDATAGPVTVTLLDVATRVTTYDVQKIDSSSNAVTVDGDGGQTINDETTLTLRQQYDTATLLPAGAEWRIL